MLILNRTVQAQKKKPLQKQTILLLQCFENIFYIHEKKYPLNNNSVSKMVSALNIYLFTLQKYLYDEYSIYILYSQYSNILLPDPVTHRGYRVSIYIERVVHRSGAVNKILLTILS